MKRNNLTVKDHARRIKMTPAGVRKAIKTGRIPINADGTIDYEKAVDFHHKNTDPSFQRNKNHPPDLLESKKLYESYRAKLVELEYNRMTGMVIDREEVKREARETGRIIRERLMGIPNRVAPLILGELGIEDTHFQQKIYTILTKEIHDALEALQEDPSMLAK